jgi:acyl-CoA synthetase (AMP-forming)/AMP-acid ligase II
MAKQQTLWGLIVERARTSPNQRFSLDCSGRQLSFLEFRDSVMSTAQGFYNLGIRENDRVAWQLPTWQDTIILSAALNRLGAVQIPLFPSLRKNEVSYICNVARPKLLITTSQWKNFDYADLAKQVQQQLTGKAAEMKTLIVDPGTLPTASPQLNQIGHGIISNDTLPVRWIFSTSGTTSAPKTAMHTDTPFVSVGYAMNAALENSSSDVIPMFFPFTHVGGLMWLASTLLAGSQLLLADTFDAESIAFASAEGATIAGSGTAFHMAYLNTQNQNTNKPLFPAIRSFPGGGAPKPPELHYQVMAAFDGAGIISGYGLTECPIISMNTVRDPHDKLANTEGRLLPGMLIKIVKTDGSLCSSFEEGEIRVRGPHLCVGFLDEELNKTAFDDDGYFSTGDIGFLDHGGWLTISGRIKDVIIRKGENISAKKIEDLLYLHDVISDVAVIGLADVERGEIACAVVQLKTGGASLTFSVMQQYCLDGGLVIQEVPERLEIVAELPRNISGKILKADLKKYFNKI